MESKILESIVEITRHRDLDSLELAFVATLHEMLPLGRVTLYRATHRPDELEEIISLVRGGKEDVSWSAQPKIVSIDAQMVKALDSLEILTRRIDDATMEWVLPVAREDKAQSALVLHGDPSLADQQSLVEGFARIYGNYMAILHEAEHDKLTGLLNRRTFDDRLSRLLKVRRGSLESEAAEPAWLAVLDIDHFKQVNDTFGHVYGDEILLLLAQQMREYFDEGDLLFRVGGEEFVIVLAHCAEQDAELKLDAFRQQVADRKFPQGLHMTVSIGFAKIGERDYPRRIFDLADKALYFAKNHGRDQVCCYEALLFAGELVEEDTSGSVELF